MRFHVLWCIVIALLQGYGSVYGLLPFNAFGDSSYGNQVKNVKRYIDQLNIEPIELQVKESDSSSNKLQRAGFLATRPNALGTIIFCHGYTSSKHESFFFKTFFPNFNAVTFDFRAHGDLADGQYSTIGANEIYDVAAAVEFVKSHPELKDKPVIGFGFSMGAVSLIRAQARWNDLFDMLILDSPFDSSDDCMSRELDKKMTINVLGRSFRVPGKRLIMRSLYNERLSPIVRYIFKWITGFNPSQIATKYVRVAPVETASNVKVPCLFITCVKDNKVSVESVRNLYYAVDAPFKRLWITQGIKHCSAFLTSPEVYWYKLNKFVKKVLEKDMKNKEKIVDERVTISVM